MGEWLTSLLKFVHYFRSEVDNWLEVKLRMEFYKLSLQHFQVVLAVHQIDKSSMRNFAFFPVTTGLI